MIIITLIIGCTVVVDDDDVLMLRCAVLSRHDDLLNPQPNPQNHSPYCDGGSVCSSSNLASLNLNPPTEPCVCVYMTLLQAKQCADKEHYIRGVPWFAGKCPIHGWCWALHWKIWWQRRLDMYSKGCKHQVPCHDFFVPESTRSPTWTWWMHVDALLMTEWHKAGLTM